MYNWNEFYLAVSKHGIPVSILDESTWDLLWTTETDFSLSAAVLLCHFHFARDQNISLIIRKKGRGLETIVTPTKNIGRKNYFYFSVNRGIPPCRSRFNSEPVCAGIVAEVALKQLFPQSSSVFQLSLSFHQCNIFMLLQDTWRSLRTFSKVLFIQNIKCPSLAFKSLADQLPRKVRRQSIKKPNFWNSEPASARSTLAMVALCSGDFKLYSDANSITSCHLVIELDALEWVCV